MGHLTEFGVFVWKDGWWDCDDVAVPMFGGTALEVHIPGDRTDVELFNVGEAASLRRFLSLGPDHRSEVQPHLWQYYLDVRKESSSPDIPEIADPSAVWEYINPYCISLQTDEAGIAYVVVEAGCEWEIEHGLQLVLQNGERWVRVSDYTGHLTDGRAWGVRSLDDWMTAPSKRLPVRSIEELFAASAAQGPPTGGGEGEPG